MIGIHEAHMLKSLQQEVRKYLLAKVKEVGMSAGSSAAQFIDSNFDRIDSIIDDLTEEA